MPQYDSEHCAAYRAETKRLISVWAKSYTCWNPSCGNCWTDEFTAWATPRLDEWSVAYAQQRGFTDVPISR